MLYSFPQEQKNKHWVAFFFFLGGTCPMALYEYDDDDFSLTDEEYRLVVFIYDYWLKHRYAPTIREAVAHLGYSSTSVCQHRIQPLLAAGVIGYKPFSARTLHLTEEGEKWLLENRQDDD
jgi:hypothetical protein